MRLKKNRYVFKYVLLYIVIFSTVLSLLLTVRSKVYSTTYDTLVAEETARLESNTKQIEDNIGAFQAVSALIRKDTSFKTFTNSTNINYEKSLELLSLKEQLQRLPITYDDSILGTYVLFFRSNTFISNFCIAFDSSEIYPSLFSYESVSYDNWHSSIVSSPSRVYLTSEQNINSVYYKSQPPSITCIIRDAVYGSYLSQDAICFIWNTDILAQRLIGASDLYGLKLCTKDGRLLLERNMTGTDTKGFTEITNTSASNYVNTYLYIPNELLFENVSAISRIVMIYVYIGIVGLLVLTGIMFIKFILHEKRLISMSRAYVAEGYKSKRSVDYISEALTRIKSARDDADRKAAIMQSARLNEKLINACCYGFRLRGDEEELAKLLAHVGSGYIMILAETSCDSLSEVEQVVDSCISDEKLRIYFDTHMMAFILAAQSNTKANDISAVLSENDKQWLNFGISLMNAGIDGLNRAYTQAQTALWLRKSSEAESAPVYSEELKHVSELSISLTLLSKLTDVIITGEENELTNIFGELSERVSESKLSASGYMYLFSTLRVAILNAAVAIDKNESISVPEFNAGEAIPDSIEKLRISAMQLCALSCRKRLSNNTELRKRIIDFIEANISDQNLCADTIADAMQLSKAYVLRFMQSQLNKTLPSHIEDVRLDHVESLLLNTDWTIDRIMEETGFASQNTLYRAFRRRHAMTPGVWRDNYPTDRK